MPMKRGNQSRRGLNNGLWKIVKKRMIDDIPRVATYNKKRTAAWILSKLAQYTFNSIAYAAFFFHAIPMKYKNGFCSQPTANFHKILHYCALFLVFARFANVFYICTWLIFEDFNATTSLCFTILTLFLLGLSVGCGSILIGRETVQLMNTWRQVLRIFGQVGDRRTDLFSDTALNIKIIVIGGTAPLVPLMMSGLPLVYPELPVSMQFQMKQFFPDLPEFWIHFLCGPIEVIIWLLAALLAAFGACGIMISVELVIFFGNLMRTLRLNTPTQFQQMTRTFSLYKVYNAILNVWYKIVTPPAFFMASASIVVFLYISFRHTELPIYIYCFYPYVAFAIFFIEFGICYDGLIGCASAEEVVSGLRSRHMECFSRMSEQERAIGWRWSRAMRPLILNVGTFTTFNIGVPLNLWDEIVNQLVLLLNL